MTRRILLSMPLVLSFVIMICGPSACSSPDCEELCTEAQAGDCTSITGNCSSFCTSLDNVKADAGCESQNDAYEDCLTQESNVCDVNCDSAESALSNCVGTYCVTGSGAGSDDCATLIASFQ